MAVILLTYWLIHAFPGEISAVLHKNALIFPFRKETTARAKPKPALYRDARKFGWSVSRVVVLST
jgi:hypothetical protein